MKKIIVKTPAKSQMGGMGAPVKVKPQARGQMGGIGAPVRV